MVNKNLPSNKEEAYIGETKLFPNQILNLSIWQKSAAYAGVVAAASGDNPAHCGAWKRLRRERRATTAWGVRERRRRCAPFGPSAALLEANRCSHLQWSM